MRWQARNNNQVMKVGLMEQHLSLGDISPNKLYIGGHWTEALGEAHHPVFNPATGQKFSVVSEAGHADIDSAVQAAHNALEDRAWAAMLPNSRAALLWDIAAIIDDHADELALLETRDQGQPLHIARNMSVKGAAEHFRYFAGWTTKLDGTVPSVSRQDAMLYTQRVPVGVCGLITPWNFPLLIAAWKLAPALATGNTAVLKPSEFTSQSTIRLVELMQQAGLPAGVVNLVTGGGAVGAYMGEHPGINKISFTGSTAVGRSLIGAAQGNLKRLSLELGGKAASVVCQDADLEKSVPKNIANVVNNSGQVCGALSRFYIHESRYDEFVEKVAQGLEEVVVGSGEDETTTMGPLTSQPHLVKVEALVQEALETGAQAATGGQRMTGELGAGFFYPPTLLTNVSDEQGVAREEIFGPVMPVMTYSDEDDVVRRVNDSEYGLSASVWTENLARGHNLASKISAGAVRVNTVSGLDPAAPWGGMRASGWGREMGPDALDAYTEVKATWIGLE